LYNGFMVKLLSLSRSANTEILRAITLIDFELSSKKHVYLFQPASLGVKQGARFVTIESIYLDALELSPHGSSVRGKIAILNRDLKRGVPLRLIFAVPSIKTKRGVFRIEVSTSGDSKRASNDQKGK